MAAPTQKRSRPGITQAGRQAAGVQTQAGRQAGVCSSGVMEKTVFQQAGRNGNEGRSQSRHATEAAGKRQNGRQQAATQNDQAGRKTAASAGGAAAVRQAEAGTWCNPSAGIVAARQAGTQAGEAGARQAAGGETRQRPRTAGRRQQAAGIQGI